MAKGLGPFHDFGAWLAQRRLEARLSQPGAVAKARRLRLTQLSQGKISHIERGWNSDPEPALLADLATVYEISYATVVRRWAIARFNVDIQAEAQPRRESYVLDDDERSIVEAWRRVAMSERAAVRTVIEKFSQVEPKKRRNGE